MRWNEPSRLLSVDDDPAVRAVTPRLLSLAEGIASKLYRRDVSHPLLFARECSGWCRIWPGEHYDFLTALTVVMQPKVIWEFGTFRGEGTVALLEGAPGTRIYTVDHTPRDDIVFSHEDAQIVQIQDNFLNVAYDMPEALIEADLLFLDGPKDNKTEAEFLELLGKVPFKNQPILMMDDIREMPLVYVWRDLARPKLDMTSLGHFTGTGLVDWMGHHGFY